MFNNSPPQKAIVEVTHIPTTGDGTQESTNPTRAISGAEHADILLVRGLGALP
jgi:hypothetical protein